MLLTAHKSFGSRHFCLYSHWFQKLVEVKLKPINGKLHSIACCVAIVKINSDTCQDSLYDSEIFLALCFLAFFAVIKYLHHSSAKQDLTDFPWWHTAANGEDAIYPEKLPAE